MRDDQSKINPHPERVYWEGPAEKPDASTVEARNRFRNELGDAFRHAQWKAYDTYCKWEVDLGGTFIEDDLAVSRNRREREKREKREKRSKEAQQGEMRVPYAAAEECSTPSDQESQTHPHLALVGVFKVEDRHYETRADAKGNVFLNPSPPPGKTHLVLDDKSYVLNRMKGLDSCQVINLRRGQLSFFFAKLREKDEQHHIGFSE